MHFKFFFHFFFNNLLQNFKIVNDCICHFSPLSSEHGDMCLNEGDWVKVFLLNEFVD